MKIHKEGHKMLIGLAIILAIINFAIAQYAPPLALQISTVISVVLFNNIFGHAFDIPKGVYYIRYQISKEKGGNRTIVKQ